MKPVTACKVLTNGPLYCRPAALDENEKAWLSVHKSIKSAVTSTLLRIIICKNGGVTMTTTPHPYRTNPFEF